MDVTALVLCGGSGSRFGGDKTAAPLGAATVLDVLLEALPASWPVVCVGQERPTTRQDVSWTREAPPGGGPVAGIAAGLALLGTELVVVLGGDMPLAGPTAASLAARLAQAPDSTEVVLARDATGRVQPLLAAHRTAALRRALPAEPRGMPAMRVLDQLTAEVLDVTGDGALDVDTPADLERASRRVES